MMYDWPGQRNFPAKPWAKTDDDVWLAWFWKLSKKTLKQMMLMMRGWHGLWKLCGTTLWQMMLMMRGCPGQ